MKDLIHDCYIDKFGSIPTEDKIEEIFNNIPLTIKLLAEKWGNGTQKLEKIYLIL